MAMKGSPCISMVFLVPADQVESFDAMWKDHKEFMKKTHALGDDGAKAPANLREFWISRGKELKDPMNPESGETGNTFYIMNEVYCEAGGIPVHMEAFGKWTGAEGSEQVPEGKKMEDLLALHAKFGKHMMVGSNTVFTTLEDKQNALTASEGNPTIHMFWKVPAADEAAVDAMWTDHEQFMRSTHKYTTEGLDTDAGNIRLTHFVIKKGKELNDPMDPSKGETGNILYEMAESYVDAAGIKAHLDSFGKWKGAAGDQEEGAPMKALLEAGAKYTVFQEIGSGSVFTCLK